ncbi:MAG: hypothetical protein MZV65_16830 [Chromatiales bacterium]|nr:hypothetical protein [Chromatiales bacterium]
MHGLVKQQFLTEREFCAYAMTGHFSGASFRPAQLDQAPGGPAAVRLSTHPGRALGYQQGEGPALAVEQFMKDYYRTVFELNRLNDMLQLFQEAILYADDPGEPVVINKRFQARKGFIEARHERVFVRYPFALLKSSAAGAAPEPGCTRRHHSSLSATTATSSMTSSAIVCARAVYSWRSFANHAASGTSLRA